MSPFTKHLVPLLLFLSFLPRFVVGQEETLSLYETIQSVAEIISVLPVDVATGKNEILFPHVDIRYDLTYTQFRPFYVTLLTAELATKDEILECLDNFDAMSRKEQALALVAIYVYIRNRDVPLNENVIHMFSPDQDVKLGIPLNNIEIDKFRGKLRSLFDNDDVCFQTPEGSSYKTWERDFREQVALYQTIQRYEDFAVGMRYHNSFVKETLRDTSIGFLYTIALLESLTDEPVSLAPAFRNAHALNLPSDGKPYNTAPRALLAHNYLKSKSNVLEGAKENESFYETIIMWAYLLTQFVSTRRNGFQGTDYIASESLPHELTLGAIAREIDSSLVEGVHKLDNSITKINHEEVPQTNATTSPSDESFVDYLHTIAPELEMFNISWALCIPERISPSNNPELYVLTDNTRYEMCYNLDNGVYESFYRFCARLKSVDANELANAYATIDELSSKEKALLLTALTYNALYHKDVTDSEEPTNVATDTNLLIKALQNYTTDADVVFHMKARGRRGWEYNYRRDILHLQYILGKDNPFFNMGCSEEELIHQCANKSPGFLYTLASWELYSNLQNDVLPPPRESIESVTSGADSSIKLERSEEIVYSPEACQLGLHDYNSDYNLSNNERQFKIEGMRHYLLTQFHHKRYNPNNFSSNAHLGNLCADPVTLGDIAKGLLEQLQSKLSALC